MVTSKSKSRVQIKCPQCEHVFLPSIEEIRSRAGKSSRRKGASFERNIAKKLQIWWNQGITNYEFKRCPQSGGSSLKEGWNLRGDVVSNAPNFKLHIETKNAPGSFTGLHNFFLNRSIVWKWLDQATQDCKIGNKPILIINRFDMPTFCVSIFDCWIIDILLKQKITYFQFNNSSGLLIWLLNDMLKSNPELWQ